jgi:hypothetical protein
LRLAATAGLVLVMALDHAPALVRPIPSSPRLARRVNRFSSLTGAWSGAYAYPLSYGALPVPFNARIEETAGSFTGDIDEPNTYADPSAPRLFASIAGTRNGLEVIFTKTMDGTGGVAHSIYYQGTADADLSRIDGTWRVANGFSGAFHMERAGVEAEAAASRAASVTE